MRSARSSSRAPTRTVFVRGVGSENVERRPGRDAEPVALADGVEVRPGVLAEDAPVAGADRPGSPAQAAVALEERLAARPGEEAQVLRVAPARDGQARALRQLAHLGLVQLAEREAQAREGLR